MKTRSSRFFIILLHLLGVSNHHLPSWYYDYYLTSTSSASSSSGDQRSSFYSGIRGVHPHSITLERLDLGEIGGLDGVDWLEDHHQQQQQQHHPQQESTLLTREPFWLQDTLDGKCLGPSGGFSECGDATLWFILRRGNQRKSLRMGPFGVEEVLERPDPEEPYRYALQIVDNDYELSSTSASSATTPSSFLFSWSSQRRERRRWQQQKDCLVPTKSQQHHDQQQVEPSLELGSCAQQQTAWSWRVNPQGFLYLPDDARQSKGKECLRRTSASSAVMSSCHDTMDESASPPQRLVQFSLVRYHATTSPSSISASPISANTMTSSTNVQQAKARPGSKNKNRNKKEPKPRIQQKSSNDKNKGGGLPSTKDKAHSHASDPVAHSPIFEMNLAGRPLLSSIPSPQARKESQSSPFAALKDTNPILFVGNRKIGDGSSAATINSRKKRKRKDTTVTTAATPPQQQQMSPGKLRKIEMNPYIAASNNEIWVDPLTGLEYHTDLCRYLGHDRKGYGRHTLVGVGQFMKTMLKIKVYGIAFYVSKRDVLADPSFQQYAGQSSEELREQPGFYEKLRSRGGFDRTLVLKTNMQLATETMRSSLDSDWKMLTEDDKKLLINSSMEPRPAEQQMLDEIRRADNPSRCSCAQTAPEEYEADPSCCARGIELAFTWRKNGDFEVRLNWRLMDAYPRPDIGLGIFFEYLRTDDPFSPDFLERAVDGFPFLLAPLAQVQGITSSVMQSAPSEVTKEPAHVSLMKAVGGAADVVTSHAVGLASVMQHGAAETAATAAHAVQSAGDTVRHFGEEAERKRIATWKQMVAFSQQHPAEVLSELVARAKGEKTDEIKVPEEPEQAFVPTRNAPHGKIFRPTTSKWFGETMDAPDEIAPMVHPTMNKTILSLVHLYLLLILIISFPATNASKTRFVVRRSCKMMSVSSSETSLVRFEVESGKKYTAPRRDTFGPLNDYRKSSDRMRSPIAPEPPRIDDDDHLVEMYPEDGSDPANETNGHQRISIDLSSQDDRKCKECKVRRHRNGKRFVSVRTARSQSLDCPGSERSSASDASAENPGIDNTRNWRNNKNGKKNSANDKMMKKSLSYFL